MRLYRLPSFLCVFAYLLLVSQTSAASVNVLTCEPEWKALAEAIGGNRIDAYSATTAMQDPHNVQARPSLISKARRADLLICSGAELEVGWLPILLRKSSNPNIQPHAAGYFMAADHVELMGQPTLLDRSQGDVHAAGNPHVHLAPYKVLDIAEKLSLRLQEIDRENATFYQEKLMSFTFRWNEAIKNWSNKAKPLKGTKAVTHHRDWIYLFHWLGIEEIANLEPKPGIPPNAGHLAKLKSLLEKQPVDFIVRTAYQEERPSKWLADKTGITAIQLPFTVGGNKNASDLFSLYDEMIDLLLEAQTN